MNSLPTSPLLSIIIPTHNRPEALKRTLASLAEQVLPGNLDPGKFEVLVIDNGAENPDFARSLSRQIGSSPYPFELNLLRHDQPGPTQARNLGAQTSRAELLVFLDDDICIAPTGLAALFAHSQQGEKTIYLGALTLPDEILRTSPFARAFVEPLQAADHEVHYTLCKTGLLALPKTDFFNLDMFQDPTGGWPNWDDVDFGYRAHRRGYGFQVCVEAVGIHWDYAARSLTQAALRLERAGASAVRLFQVYPDLQHELPMFRDMLPYNPSREDSRLKRRKFARRLASSQPMLWSLEQIARLLEAVHLPPVYLRNWYTWVIGGYIYRGVQKGIRMYGAVPQ